MSHKFNTVALLATATFCAPAMAQSVGFAIYNSNSMDHSWSRDAGPVEVAFDLEGSYRAFQSGSASVTPTSSADLRAAATVGIYGTSKEVAEVEAEFVAKDGSSPRAEWSVAGRLMGYTLYSNSGSTSVSTSKSWSRNLSFRKTLASYNFVVGPIPVTVGFEVGSSLGIDLSAAILPASQALSFSGEIDATAGECAFTVGVGFMLPYVGLGAGVTTEIDFGRVRAEATALVSMGLQALRLEYSISAVCLELALKAWGYLGPFRTEWRKTIFERCWGTVSGSQTI